MYSVGCYYHSDTYLDTKAKAMISCFAYNDFFKEKKTPLKQKALFCFRVNKWEFYKSSKRKRINMLQCGNGLNCSY